MLRRIRDRLDGLANPIMVKALYQSLHSRASLAFFWLLLVVALFIYYVSVGASADEPSGAAMFTGFSVLMGLMMMLVIPTLAFIALRQEITSRTMELVQITAMSARQLVRGRLLAAGGRIIFLFSLIGPFAVASFLFGGIDAVTVLMTVYHMLLASFVVCALAVFCGSLAAFRSMRTLSVLAFVGLILMGGWSVVGLVPMLFVFRAASGMGGMGMAGRSLLLMLVWETVSAALLIMFLASAAANSLTFPQGRSSARTKLVALIIVAALWGGIISGGISGAPAGGTEAAAMFEIMACAFLGVCCLFWVMADRHVPPRHAARLKRFGAPGRLLYAPFRDGPLSSLLYAALGMALVGVGASLIYGRGGRGYGGVDEWLFYPIPLTVTYVLYLTALAGAATRLLPRRRRSAATRRALLLVVLLVNTLPLFILPLVYDWNLGALTSIPAAFFPLLYMVSLYETVPFGELLVHLALPFLLGLVYHLAAASSARAAEGA